MKTLLTHLTETQQTEITEILEIIKEEAQPKKVILFGYHAKTSSIEVEPAEDSAGYFHTNDYDFLVVIKGGKGSEFEIKSHVINRCNHLKNAVSPIIHDIDYINSGIHMGQKFFVDIINKGILLFDIGDFVFEKFKELTHEEEITMAQGYFDIWYPKAVGFLKYAIYALEDLDLKLGVFFLHQATESFYATALFVTGGYKPKTHNLEFLRDYSKHISADLFRLFLIPKNDIFEKHLFDLLKRGYIDSRYKIDYTVTVAELSEMINRVSKMQEIVLQICQKKIKLNID